MSGRVGIRCKHPRCWQFAEVGSRFCEEHKGDEPRRWGNEPLPFYSTARWQKIRAKVLERDPICVHCESEQSSVANHRMPARFFPELRFRLSNIEGVCRACHDEISRREQSIYARLGSAALIRAYFESAFGPAGAGRAQLRADTLRPESGRRPDRSSRPRAMRPPVRSDSGRGAVG